MSNETLIAALVFVNVVQFSVIGYLLWLLNRSGDEKRDMFTVEMLQAMVAVVLSGATAIVDTTPSPDDNKALADVKNFLSTYAGIDTASTPMAAGGLTASPEATLTADFVSETQDALDA